MKKLNLYDKIQVWHLIAIIVFGFFLFFLVIKITHVRPFEPYQEKVVIKIVSDYQKLLNAQYGNPELFHYEVVSFTTDPSYKNWDKSKASKELSQIIDNLELAENNMDTLKELTKTAILELEKHGDLPASLQPRMKTHINEIETCINNVKTLSK